MQQLEQPRLDGFSRLFKSFLEAGRRSLSAVKGVFLTRFHEEDFVQNEWPLELIERARSEDVSVVEISIEEAEARQVVAIDTSSIIVATDRKGVVTAVRGSLVTRTPLGLTVEKIGPFIAYITQENMPEVLASILDGASPLDYCAVDYQLDGSIQKVLAGLLEKRLQEYVAEKYRNSILLFDGSLSAGPLDNPLWLVSRILEKALPRGNDVLAFSKTSILQFWGEVFTEEKLGISPPYAIDMTWLIKSIEMRVKVLGKTFLAKLSPGAGVFRVDVSTTKKVQQVFGDFLRSDSLIYGYPELLILAHDYCTFTKVDVMAIQSLLKRYGSEFFEIFSIRDMLFNPLDGEWRR